MRARNPKRLADFPRPRAKRAQVFHAAPPFHRLYALCRLDCADEDGAGTPLPLADEIQTPVNAIGAINVSKAWRAEHHGVALGAAAKAMRGGIGVMIGLD